MNHVAQEVKGEPADTIKKEEEIYYDENMVRFSLISEKYLVSVRDVPKYQYRYRYRLISVKILGIGIGLFQPIPNWYRFKNTIKINIY